MKSIRVLGRTADNHGEGTIRIFKEGQEALAIAFMRDWIKYGAVNDMVYAYFYENGKRVKFLKGFKKKC